MSNKIIVFDLDETLRKLDFDENYQRILNVRFRPKLKELLEKLKEVKEKGINVAICTTASIQSVNTHFLKYLPEKYNNIFTNIYSTNNKIQVKSGSLEEEVYGQNGWNKPVTAIDNYNQILFFDDNTNEGLFLKKLYLEETSPNKQVFFSSYQYNPLKASQLYAYKKIAPENSRMQRYVNKMFAIQLEEPGCGLMIEKIEEFQNSKFEKGLTIDDNNPKMEKYKDDVLDLEEEIEAFLYNNKLWKKYNDYIKEYHDIIRLHEER